jgi:hypothetical protein
MKCWFAGSAGKVAIDCDSRHPSELVAGEDERPGVSLFAGHARVDKDVLELP